jgi:hypothetical protein
MEYPPELRLERQLSEAYERTNWEKVGEMVRTAMLPLPEMGAVAQLDQTVYTFIDTTIIAVERHIPQARPPLYSKRWFTPDLKAQRTKRLAYYAETYGILPGHTIWSLTRKSDRAGPTRSCKCYQPSMVKRQSGYPCRI